MGGGGELLGLGSPRRSVGLSEVWSLDLGMQGFPFSFLGKGGIVRRCSVRGWPRLSHSG